VVTVLLPTVARASLLRLALQSVASQTALAKISRIFVSENGGDRASEAVCREFPHLPITYIFRDPALPPLEHAQVLMKECLEGEFIAILHDDDWWLPNHMEDALAAFEAGPDASVYGANRVMYDEAESRLSDRNCELFPWFAANYPHPSPLWRIAHADILLGSLLGLVVHYSTLVARAEALRQSAFVYDLGNPFDNDRMILFALSQRGPVLFGTRFSAGIRLHRGRETARVEWEKQCQRMAQTTEWMVASGSDSSWVQVAAAFAQRVAQCPDDKIKVDLIREATIRPWCLPELARHLDRTQDKDFFAMYDRARHTFAGKTPQDDR